MYRYCGYRSGAVESYPIRSRISGEKGIVSAGSLLKPVAKIMASIPVSDSPSDRTMLESGRTALIPGTGTVVTRSL